MSNKGWQKQLYRSEMLTSWVCPLCGKPTQELDSAEGKMIQPKTRENQQSSWKEYQFDWQCLHCQAWHEFPIGYAPRGNINYDVDDTLI